MPVQSVTEFLSQLRALGVRVSAEGDRLGCSAPKGVLTPGLRVQLTQRKAEILSLLRSLEPAAATPELRALDRQGELPLSSGQRRLWFLEQFEKQTAAYNIVFGLELEGALDTSALEASLREIIRRHEVLRTRLVQTDGAPKAVVEPCAEWKLERSSLQATDDFDRSKAITRLAQDEARRPFDLTRGPLLRALLIEFGDRDHVLVLIVHHIAADGWSLAILLQELTRLYPAYLRGLPSPLPELSVRYADFAVWQNEMLHTPPIRAQMQYWRRQLQPPLPVLELPGDRARPAIVSSRGALTKFVFPPELAAAAADFSRSEQATVFVTLLAAFYVLLHRYTGQEDLPVGSAIAGRIRPEIEPLIGLFINNLVLRTSVAGDPTVRELIQRVRETSLSAYAHQDFPFDELVTALQPERNLNHSPLFQVMFILQNFPFRSYELPDLSMRLLEVDAGTARYDLIIEARHREEGAMDLNDQYKTEQFEETTVQRFARHYRNLLEAMIADPQRRISELPMLAEDEVRALVAAGEHTRAEYPRHACLHELIDRQAEAAPERVAVVCGSERMCYGELRQRSNQIANLLRRMGIGPGALAGVCMERSVDIVAALLGVLKAGGAYVPMDPHFPRERLAFMAEDAALTVLLTQESLRGVVEAPGATLVSLDGDAVLIAQQSEQAPPNTATPDDLAYVIFTSGSTGRPKGVQIAHRSVVNFLESMRREPGLTAEDRLVSVTTLSFDIAGLELYLPLLTGAQVILATRAAASDGLALARLLAESEATVMQATPATWRLLLESGWNGQHGLKILCGGEALPRELANRLLAAGSEVWNLYGPTETTIWSTLHRVQPGEGAVPIGKPIANTELYLLDAHGQPAPPGAAGELYIGGDGLARGYLNRPELTAGRFVPHPFIAGQRLYRTGDLARFQPDGTLHYLGRSDFQIKIRGFRVELGEIEAALERCPGVKQAVVALREDTPGDQRLVAYLAPRDEAAFALEALRAQLQKSLPDYMIPSAFVFQTSFPLTPNGKVNRLALAPPAAGPTPDGSVASPRNETEERVAAVWQELLKREHVGIHDNFFDLGGHSLLLVQLQSRLREKFGKEISVLEMFQRPTVARMAEFLAPHHAPGVCLSANAN